MKARRSDGLTNLNVIWAGWLRTSMGSRSVKGRSAFGWDISYWVDDTYASLS